MVMGAVLGLMSCVKPAASENQAAEQKTDHFNDSSCCYAGFSESKLSRRCALILKGAESEFEKFREIHRIPSWSYVCYDLLRASENTYSQALSLDPYRRLSQALQSFFDIYYLEGDDILDADGQDSDDLKQLEFLGKAISLAILEKLPQNMKVAAALQGINTSRDKIAYRHYYYTQFDAVFTKDWLLNNIEQCYQQKARLLTADKQKELDQTAKRGLLAHSLLTTIHETCEEKELPKSYSITL